VIQESFTFTFTSSFSAAIIMYDLVMYVLEKSKNKAYEKQTGLFQ